MSEEESDTVGPSEEDGDLTDTPYTVGMTSTHDTHLDHGTVAAGLSPLERTDFTQHDSEQVQPTPIPSTTVINL